MASTKQRKLDEDEFKDVELSDIEIHDVAVVVDGEEVFQKSVKSIKGFDANRITVRHLRKICVILKVSGYKAKTKAETLMLIGQHKFNKDANMRSGGDGAGTGEIRDGIRKSPPQDGLPEPRAKKKRKLDEDEFKDVELSDIEVVDVAVAEVFQKSVKTIKGFDVNHITVQHLRKLCSTLKISGYKNKTKTETLELIGQHKFRRDLNDYVHNGDGANIRRGKMTNFFIQSRKRSHCTFRLVNILLSDDFSQRLIDLETSRAELELGSRVSPGTKLWMDVQAVFVDDSNDEIGLLQCEHAAFDAYGIDPSVTVSHPWKKLRALYTDLKSRHKVAMAEFATADFTVSATHGSEFSFFCHGQMDVLYLRLFCRGNPVWYVSSVRPCQKLNALTLPILKPVPMQAI